jgi:hypothetical protein
MINLSTKIQKVNGNIVFMPNVFENKKHDFGNYIISFDQTATELNIVIECKEEVDIEIKKVFWNLYDYLGIILGYFPKILNATFINEKQLFDIVEQYKTKECFIRCSEQFIKNLSQEQFIQSFKKFITINEKAKFQLSMFNIAMMKNNSYPELALVNTLQALDGLFDTIFVNKSDKKQIVKSKIAYISNKVNSNKELDEKNIEYIVKYMQNVGIITFIDKLVYFSDYTKYNVFEFEKSLEETNKYQFHNLLSMFVNTRNKISHSVEKNKVLNGTESSIYIFKIIILYRLLIFEKIGLIDLINEEDFIKKLKEWDDYIQETLKGEDK